MSADKRSISAPAELFAQADIRARKMGYRKFAHYIQKLIEDDVARQSPHVRGEPVVYSLGSQSSKFNEGGGDSLAAKLAGAEQAGKQAQAQRKTRPR